MIPLIPRRKMKSRYNENKGPYPSPSVSEIDPVHDLLGKKDISNSNNGWRRYGFDRRRQLIEQDTAEGGNRFDLNFQCRIQGYFALAEKIITKFDESFTNGGDLEATYVMGHRLVHFLTEALPMHPSYMKRDPVVSRLREKSFQSLVRVKKQIEAISLRIDEEELNKYILHDFDPFADDDDDSCSSSGSETGQVPSSNLQWESFDGWSFDLPAKMTRSADFVQQDVSLLSCKDLDDSGDTEDTFSSSEVSLQDSSVEQDQEPIYDTYGLEFLKQISSEAVRYETDSEADDSWAQECESEERLEFEDEPSIGDTSYDPARIALQELILNKRLLQRCAELEQSKNYRGYGDQSDDCKENQSAKSLDFDLSPDNTFDADADADEEDIWVAFDPTARLSDTPTESMERVSL